MENEIERFISYLRNTKKTSDNTKVSYERDLKKMMQYFRGEQGITSVARITETSLNSYMLYLENHRFAPSTVSRNVAAIRAFFHFLLKEHMIDVDPSQNLHPPKVEKKMPEIMSVEEVTLLLEQPNEATAKGIRDKAMLELLYATGIRVSELIHLKLSDINLNLSYLICREGEKERIIPFGEHASTALSKYLDGSRQELLHGKESDNLFQNCSGGAMSRQGFWKVLKAYTKAAGIEKDITPHTLRHSFGAHLVQNGADLRSVQEMMGHSDISSTQMYLNMHVYKIRDVYAKAHPRM